MKSKKAIQIQISMLVIIILTVVTLIIGLNILFSKVLKTQNDAKLVITREVEIRMIQELKKGDKVNVNPAVITKDNNKFYVGIKNIFSDEREFKINFSLYQKNAEAKIVYPNDEQFILNASNFKISSFIINKNYLKNTFNNEFPFILIINVYYKNGTDWMQYHNSVIKVEG
ncbi:MAG: hypothetical protein QXS41_00070 [Candidatus Woesearchaeota archaeon]